MANTTTWHSEAYGQHISSNSDEKTEREIETHVIIEQIDTWISDKLAED